MIRADGVELNNLTLNADEEFMMNGEALILVTSKYVSLINNAFNYTAPENTEAYVIYADSAKGLKLIDNEITFVTAFTKKEIFANALFITDSSDVEIRNNTLDITIPSVDIDYDDMSRETVYSEGILIEKSNSAVIRDNNIAVEYNNAVGSMDTLRAVDIKSSDNVIIENNIIAIEGHKYAYALVINGNDFNINNNSVDASSDINYVNGININGPASGIVQFNTISAVSPNASYPVYSSAYNGDVYVEYENNTVYGSANDVYGIYVSGTNENITGNNVTLTGNFTIGIASLADNVIVSKNTIKSLASNEGTALNMDIIPCVTSGVTSEYGNSIVDDNTILTTGNYTVNIIRGKAINNYLIANNIVGDKSVYPRGTSVLIEYNTPLMKTANLTVNNVSFNIGDEIVFNVTLTGEDNNPLVNYMVDLDINGTNYHALTDKEGIATFEVDSLPEGIYEMEFIVDNKNIMELIEETAILNITLNNLKVNVTASNIREGEDLIINVTVPDNLKEDLIIRINDTDYKIKNSDSIIVSNLTAGEYPICVYYPGDDYYNEYSDEFNVIVYGKDEIVVDVNEPFEGEDLIINVDGPKDITGNVTITVGDKTFDVPFENGNANVVISNISKGVYPVSINYPGDGNYEPYTFECNVTVNPKVVPKENLTLDAVANPIVAGENATVVVSGFANATGEVTLTVNGKTYTVPIADGTAIFDVSGLTENATAVISYSGDDNYNAASATVDIVVNPAPVPKKDLNLNASVFALGKNTTIIVTGFENATGNVSVTIGENNYTSPIMMGMAFVSIPQIDKNVTAYIYYPGDEITIMLLLVLILLPKRI